MQRILQILTAGLATLAWLVAAASLATAAVDPETPSPLADSYWHLVEFQSMSDRIGTLKPEDPALYTMHLAADGTVTMQLNCNTAQGQWTAEPSADIKNGRFAFAPLAATQAICPPPSLDERVAKDAAYIRGYLLEGDRLFLSLMADGGIYVWQRLDQQTLVPPPLAPEDGGPRNWQVTLHSGVLNLRQEPATTAPILATFDRGTILDNLGCEPGERHDWCYVQPLGGGPVGYVAAEYLQPAISPSGEAMTGPDDSALRAGQGDFDATGSIPCAQERGQPMRDCTFGVARAGGGYATVIVTRPDNVTRAIYFRMGQPIGADTSEADGYPEFHVTKENDLHFIRIGDERYEIPDAVIFGG
jgi:heat shock protein HslJ